MTKASSNNTPKKSVKRRTFVYLTGLITLLSLVAASILLASQQLPTSTTQTNSHAEPTPQPEKYFQLSADLQEKQKQLKQRYQSARTNQKKKAILQEARVELNLTLPAMMRCWIGTEWDFNGTSTTPGEGKIACGYFVSTLLRDAGFKIHRVRLAQQASQNIILSLVKDQDKTVNPRRNYDDFIEYFKKQPEGIYIIGLDTHVGYLLNFNQEVHFLHSGARGVVDETPDQATDIQRSKYRVIGNITQHDYIIEKWILGTQIKTKT